MTTNTDDLRIRRTNELVAPQQLISDIALDETAAQTVSAAR
ncbi:MAG TPA: 3-deoxy-7-phosphoheptulonate synthase, partial [Halieaceae bacterium]|nr:3-deoxy-7-phosphoheptulonate synthase [Halieaceae bacterium]